MGGNEAVNTFGNGLVSGVKVLAQIVAATWMLWIFNALLLGRSLNRWGIRPRTIAGLWGIPLSPFLHADPEHLLGNTIIFLILGGMVLLKGVDTFIILSIVTALSSGLGTWLIGRNLIHIGASGVIFGYMGFLMLRGYVEYEVISCLLSLFMLFYYSRKYWRGIFDAPEQVSWEMHLFGFLGGLGTARYLEAIMANLPKGWL